MTPHGRDTEQELGAFGGSGSQSRLPVEKNNVSGATRKHPSHPRAGNHRHGCASGDPTIPHWDETDSETSTVS